MAKPDPAPVRKVVTIDAAVLRALEGLARDGNVTLDALADEALRDLLKKHQRPTSLKEALRASTRRLPANDRAANSKRLAK